MRAWKEGLNFHDLVLADKEITGRVPRKQIEYAFDLQRQLKNVDKIFRPCLHREKTSRTPRKIAAKKKPQRSEKTKPCPKLPSEASPVTLRVRWVPVQFLPDPRVFPVAADVSRKPHVPPQNRELFRRERR